VSALGASKRRFWEGLIEGTAPFRPVTRFDTSPRARLYAAEVEGFEPPVPVKAKQPWTANRSIQFAIAAAREALGDAGLALTDQNRSRIGVVFGSTRSCLDLTIKLDLDGILRGPRAADPMLFPDANPCAPSCRVSLQLGLRGFNATLSNGSTSGLDAIEYAANAIREGLAPVALAGGIEELTRATFLFHQAMERLAEEPVPYAPFSGRGSLPGEGCAVLVLEDEEHARRRNASVLAEVSGYGTCYWPEGLRGDPAGVPLETATRNALLAARLQPEQVDVVFAGANGDPWGDRLEARALAAVTPTAAVTPVKAALGETYSAGGALQAAACVLAMQERLVPAVAGMDGARSLVPGLLAGPKPGPVRAALINSFSTSDSTHISSALALKAI
jgi:3-oxoacyl-(acyl-carrier-protein) synthase